MKYHSPSLLEIPSCHDSQEPARTTGYAGELRMNYAKHHIDPMLIFKSWPDCFLHKCLFQSMEAESLHYDPYPLCSIVGHLEWSLLFAGALTLNAHCSQEGISFPGCSLLQPIPCRKTIFSDTAHLQMSQHQPKEHSSCRECTLLKELGCTDLKS